MWIRETDGSATLIDDEAFAAGDSRPTFGTANSLLFITKGNERKKFDGTDLTNWGIAAPDEAPVGSATGSGGSMMAAVWDVLITFYNDDTGHESGISASDEVTITTGDKLDVDWSSLTPDDQVTHVMVYLRNRTVGPNYYRAIVGSTPASDANGGFPIDSVTSAEFDITDTQFENLRILAPEENDNQPPPAGCSSPTWHGSRMFVHDGSKVYFSDIEKPESFNIVSRAEPVNPDDGDPIKALHSSHDLLLVLKDKSTHAIDGEDPNSWSIRSLSPNIGCVNQASVLTHGATYWWDAQKGPIRYAGPGTRPEAFGVPSIGPTIDPELLNVEKLNFISAVVDDAPSRQRILFAVPELGSDRPSLILPYNLQLQVWESTGWNPFDVASMAVAEDSLGTPWVFLGGYSGKLFQLWNATNDGVPESEPATGLVVSSTNTTLTVTTPDEDDIQVSPDWITDDLKELFVYAISSDGLDVQRRRITANTTDTLTVTPAWGANPNSTYTFVVGGIDFQWDTPWMHSGVPFNKKRYEFFFVQASSPDSGVPVNVDLFFSYDDLNVSRAKSMELLGAVVYDSAIYDVDRYASAVLDDDRIRMSKTGKAWRARVRNINPDQELTLLKVAMQSIRLSTHS